MVWRHGEHVTLTKDVRELDTVPYMVQALSLLRETIKE